MNYLNTYFKNRNIVDNDSDLGYSEIIKGRLKEFNNYELLSCKEIILRDYKDISIKEITFDIKKIKKEANKHFNHRYDLIPDYDDCRTLISNIYCKSLTIDEINNKLSESIDDKISKLLQNNQNLDWNKCYVTGGSLANLVKNLFYEHVDNDINSDIDIIIIVDNICELEFRNVICKFVTGIENYIISRYDETYIVTINDHKYQFFQVLKNSFITTILRYHLCCCRAFYNKHTGLRVTPSCFLSNFTLINYIQADKAICDNIIKKYLNRGYSMLINDEEKKLIKLDNI